MKHRLLVITAWLFFQLVITGCKNTHERVNDFVADYNYAAASMHNEIITQSTAIALPNNEIRIVFNTSMAPSKENKALYNQLLPSMVSGIVATDRNFTDLTEEGVRIRFDMLASDESELASITVDKQKLAELQKADAAEMKARVETTGQNSRLSPQLQQVIQTLNKSLPIIDKEAGTTITRIDVNENMVLVYYVETTDLLAEMLKKPGMNEVMKEELLRDPTIRKMIPSLQVYGISSIKYVYSNTKAKVLIETTVTANDLK